MKKIITFALALILAASLLSCNNDKQLSDGRNTDTSDGNVTSNESTSGSGESDPLETDYTNYSLYFDDNGYFKDIKASEHITLFDYKKIPVPSSIHTPSEEEIQEQIDTFLIDYQYPEKILEGEIKDGDSINIDYVGKVDGVEFEGGSTSGNGTSVTIGVTSYIDDFLEQLIGHNPGETFDIEVTFPDNYTNADLSKKDAIFTVTINYIEGEYITPEFTDEFVAENLTGTYGWENVEAVKKAIVSSLSETAIRQYFNELMLEKSILKDQVPALLIEFQELYMLDWYRQYAAYYSMSLEDFLVQSGEGASSAEELIESYKIANTESALSMLIFQSIAEDADIKITENDVDEYFKSMGYEEVSTYEEMYGINYLKMLTLASKIESLLYENVVLE